MERCCKVPVVLTNVHRVEVREPGGRQREVHQVGPVLVVPLVGPEEEQPIPLDWAPQAKAHERAVVVGLRESRWRARGLGDAVGHVLGGNLKRVESHYIVVLIAEKGTALPGVSTGLRGRRDDRAGRFLVLGLEVLTDDPVFLNRAPRERIPLARVLPYDALPREIVLEAGAVNEDVHRVRALSARCKRARDTVDPVVGDGDARRERGEVEEVPARGWERLDLPLCHVGRDFGRPHLYTLCRDHGHRFDLHG